MKQIILNIPSDKELPYGLQSLCPDDCFSVLCYGYDTITNKKNIIEVLKTQLDLKNKELISIKKYYENLINTMHESFSKINTESNDTGIISDFNSSKITLELCDIDTPNTVEIYESEKLKQTENKLKEISEKLFQYALERDELISKINENNSKNYELIKQLSINKDDKNVFNTQFSRVIEWWNFNIINEEGKNLRSSTIWTIFKRDNPDLVGTFGPNDFKDILYKILGEDRIIKPRNKFGSLEIKNVRWKINRV